MKIKLTEIGKHTSSIKKEHVPELNDILRNYVERIAEQIKYELPQTTYGFYSILERFDIITEEQCHTNWKELWKIKYPNGYAKKCICDDAENEDC
eukprot:UN08203